MSISELPQISNITIIEMNVCKIQYLRRTYFALSIIFLLLINGCLKSATVPQENKSTETNTQPLFKFDFGIVKPNSVYTHSFTIRNDTDGDWTIRNIVPDCNCTVAYVDDMVIPAHQSIDIKLEYRTGKDYQNDSRKTVVYFEGEIEPIILLFSSQIRPDIVLQPAQLATTSYVPNKKAFLSFEVEDWTDTGLENVQLNAADADWITPNTPVKNRLKADSQRFPSWKCGLIVEPGEMQPGRYFGRIRIVASEKEMEYSTSLMVALDVSPVVRVVPSSLFFGEIEVGETKTIESTILVVSGEIPGITENIWESMSVEQSLAKDILQCQIEKESETRGLLRVTITPKTDSPVEEKLFLKIGHGLHDLTLPVIVHVTPNLTHSFNEGDE